jgi:DNA-binding CsgD family transcriptional regulator
LEAFVSVVDLANRRGIAKGETRSAEDSPAQPRWPAAEAWPQWAAYWFMFDRAPRVIVSRDLRVLAVNGRGLEVIAESHLLSISEGRLLARGPLAVATLDEAVLSAGGQDKVHVLGAGHATLALIAVAASNRPDEPVSLTLRDLSDPVEIDLPNLGPIFGVTRSEQRSILGLLRGHSSRECAHRNGMSVLTLRTHLKRAYAKMEVRSRTQLFALLAPYMSLRPAPRGGRRT